MMDLLIGFFVAVFGIGPASAIPITISAAEQPVPFHRIASSDKMPSLAQIAGTYRVEGRNTDGSRYTGRVQIRVDGGKALFRWEVGRDVFLGEGTLNGDVLTVYWGQPEPVIYILRADGRLQGSWASGRASEVLTPLR